MSSLTGYDECVPDNAGQRSAPGTPSNGESKLTYLQSLSGSLALALLVTTFGCSTGPVVEELSFQCAERDFVIRISGKRATLIAAPERYDLLEKPSGIGRKYASSEATLIIDDDYAAFVTDNNGEFRDCRRKNTWRD